MILKINNLNIWYCCVTEDSSNLDILSLSLPVTINPARLKSQSLHCFIPISQTEFYHINPRCWTCWTILQNRLTVSKSEYTLSFSWHKNKMKSLMFYCKVEVLRSGWLGYWVTSGRLWLLVVTLLKILHLTGNWWNGMLVKGRV